jgi:WYL domain
MRPPTSSRTSQQRRTVTRPGSPSTPRSSRSPAASLRLGTIEEIDAPTCEYRTGDDDLECLAERIAMLGVEFEVHEPPELAEQLRVLASRLTRGAHRSH